MAKETMAVTATDECACDLCEFGKAKAVLEKFDELDKGTLRAYVEQHLAGEITLNTLFSPNPRRRLECKDALDALPRMRMPKLRKWAREAIEARIEMLESEIIGRALKGLCHDGGACC